MNIEDILSKTFVTNQELISEVLLVDTNPCELNIVKVEKINSIVSKKTEKRKHYLYNYKTSISKLDSQLAADVINKLFIETISSEPNQIIKWTEKKLFGLLSKINYSHLSNFLTKYNWIIISQSVFEILSKHFRLDKKDELTFQNVGLINSTTVFLSTHLSGDNVVVGNFESCEILILKDIFIENKNNIYNISLNYLFNTKNILSIKLE